MTTITTRSGKGSPLTNNEVDANFTNLNDDKVEASGDNMTGNLSFGDNNKAIFGAGSDLQIYHDPSRSYISDQGTGGLRILTNALEVMNAGETENLIYAAQDGYVRLYHNGLTKLETTSTGIDVTGTVVADGLESSGGLTFTAADGIEIAGKESIVMRIDSDDNDSNRVFNVVSGSSGSQETLINAAEDSGVTLYYDNAAKIATTSTGIDVTGAVTADSLTVGDSHTIGNGTGDNLLIQSSSGENITLRAGSTREILLQTDNSSGNAIQIYANNDVAFYEDTGNTAKLFWDASEERLGVGTTSPVYNIHSKTASGATGIFESTASDSTVYFKDSGTTYDYSNGIGSVGDDLRFRSGDGSERMRINSTGVVDVKGAGSASAPSLILAGDDDTGQFRPSANQIAWATGGTERLRVKNWEVTVNEQSSDVDFRVESDVDSHAFFVNAENSRIGIRTSNPSYNLDLISSSTTNPLGIRWYQQLSDATTSDEQIGVRVDHIRNESSGNTMLASGDHTGFSYNLSTGGSGNSVISGDTYGVKVRRAMGSGGNTTGTNYGYYYHSETYGSSGGASYAFYVSNVKPDGGSGARYAFYNNDAAATSVFNGSNVFNESSADVDFRIESDNNANILFIDASADTVNIGNTTDFGGILNVNGGLNSKQAVFTSTNNRGLALSTASRGGQNDGVAIIDAQDTEATGGRFEIHTMGAERARFERDQIVFNEGSNDQDFRVESDDNTHALYVDANTSTVGINSQSTSDTLTVFSSASDKGITIHNGSTSGFENPTLTFIDQGNSTSKLAIRGDAFCFDTYNAANTVQIVGNSGLFKANNASQLEGGVVINDNSTDVDFRVESDSNANMLFVDASKDKIYVGKNTDDSSTTTSFEAADLVLAGTSMYQGRVPNTSNDNSGFVRIFNLTTANTSNVGCSFVGRIIFHSYTGSSMVDIHVTKHYTNDNVNLTVINTVDGNASVPGVNCSLVTATVGSNSYLGIQKTGGGTGATHIDAFISGGTHGQVYEERSGDYTVTTTHGTIIT